MVQAKVTVLRDIFLQVAKGAVPTCYSAPLHSRQSVSPLLTKFLKYQPEGPVSMGKNWSFFQQKSLGGEKQQPIA